MRAEIKNISKSFGKVKALQNVSAIFESGMAHVIIGPNGAGKTTLLRIMAGLLHPDAGEISFSRENPKGNIGYFPQEPSLYPDLSCQEHLRFFAGLYALPEYEFEKRSEELLKTTGMMPFRDRPAGKLSGGMYKKLGIMCVLINRPEMLILDEPTIGVDQVSRRELWELIYSFTRKNMTVILSTSYMDEAERCDKTHLLDNGKLTGSAPAEELKKQFGTESLTEIFLKTGSKA
ncbi:MAG: ABC transporter ATP-binding protein [Elusimicrobiales bacterium]|nr:ABC transporter ATP-binding protein [Elusimicrobiales bacterium]